MPLAVALVTTTIFDVPALEGYVDAAQQYGGDVRLVEIPDRRTDPLLFKRVERLQKDVAASPIQLECPALEEQREFLARVGVPEDFVPYDSDNRRNAGFLMALTEIPDMPVSVDDDNFVCRAEDFFAEHVVVCADKEIVEVAHAPRGQMNIYDMVEYPQEQVLFPRGLPYHHWKTNVSLKLYRSLIEAHINVGLRLRDPDVDAISRLAGIVHTSGLVRHSVVLSPITWTPVNSQNTSVHGSAIPAYYYIRMGDQLSGLSMDRFGNILSGYFCQVCVRSLGQAVRMGTPLVEHRHNTHSLLSDLAKQLGGILMMEDLVD